MKKPSDFNWKPHVSPSARGAKLVTDHCSLFVFQPLVFGSLRCLQRLFEQDGPLSLNRFAGMLCFFKFKDLPNCKTKMRDFVLF